MPIYNTRWFDRWARKQGLPAASACAAVREMAAGLVDADLDSSLVHTRVARPGQGKSGAFARWLPRAVGIDGALCSAFRRTSAATSTKGE